MDWRKNAGYIITNAITIGDSEIVLGEHETRPNMFVTWECYGSKDNYNSGHYTSSFHDLRHTCASLLLNKGKHNGITLKDIQVWLGHSDFATTANIYSHLDATSKTNSLSALEGVISL